MGKRLTPPPRPTPTPDPAHVLYRRVRPSAWNRAIARRELARMRAVLADEWPGKPRA